jgi:trehalose 6-phosphate synthase
MLAGVVRHKNIEYVVIDLSKDDFEEYYSGFANRVLWPILHCRLDLAEFARRDLSGYSRVNEHFATKLESIEDPSDPKPDDYENVKTAQRQSVEAERDVCVND